MKYRIKNSKRLISIILLFIVSTMLIGIFSACEGIGNDKGDSNNDFVNIPNTSQNINGESSASAESVYLHFTPELEPLSQSQLDSINAAWFEYLHNVSPSEYIWQFPEEEQEEARRYIDYCKFFVPDTPEIDRRYYGTFGDCIVLSNTISAFMQTEIKIYDFLFVYPCSTEMYVYRNGKIMGIEESVNENLLNYEQISKCYERYKQYKEYIN